MSEHMVSVFSSYINDALVVGGPDKDNAAALIIINYSNLGEWAEKAKIAYSTFTDLSQKPETYDLIRKEIEKVNNSLPEDSRIKGFICLPKELDPDEGELTRTRKLRRGFLEQRYQRFIEALYANETQFTVEVPVVYRDGRTGVMRTPVTVGEVR